MATSIGNLDIGLLVGLFGGVGSFFRGFRAYREYLLLQGTPLIPIRSMAVGLVRIHGKAASGRLVTSPISHTPCCFYQVSIEKSKDEGENGKWSHYGTEADGVRFYLEDSSGRALVDAHGAEYDIESTWVREASSARVSSVAARGASDAELLDYALQHPTSPDELFQGLVGPQVAKIRKQFEDEGPHSDPLREELRLAMIDLYKHPFWSPEYAEGFKRVTKLQEQLKKAGPRIETPPPLRHRPPPPPNPPTVDDIVASVNGPLTAAAGRYRFTERCILADHEYDITGTCGENPEAKDVSDRNLIRKGVNEPTFLISGLARPDVNAMLQIRSYFMIFGGGMLAVFCLGILLLRLGQF
jgi:hypothetical protein